MESFSLVFWLNKLKNIFSNNFINSPIQKACMEKVPGCCEHMPVVWSELKSKRAEKVILLPFDLILLMPMDLYHTNCCFLPLGDCIPGQWKPLFIKYYEGLRNVNWSDSAPSSWHHHLRDILIGSTAPILLLLSARNVIIEHVSVVTEDEIYNTMTSLFSFKGGIIPSIHVNPG